MVSPNNGEPMFTRTTGTVRVNVAFDLDGPTGGAMLNGSLWDRPGYFVLGAHDAETCLPRVLDMLQDQDIRATFFIPTWVMLRWPDACARIVEEGHEAAAHGHRHEVFHHLTRAEQAAVLARSQEVFREVLGREAEGFRAPSGDVPVDFYELLRDHGYRFSSSMRSGDHPYLDTATGIVEIPTKSLFDDYGYFAYHRSPNFPSGLDRIAPYEQVFDYWFDEIEAAAEEGLTVSTIWHPKVVATPGRSIGLERLLQRLGSHDAVRFTTGRDICDEVAEDGGTP